VIAAIVLAAGASERMGVPKALLRVGHATFLERVLDGALAAGLGRRVVVLGHDADKILASINLDTVAVIRSSALSAGPIGSIRAGIRAIINHPVEGALIWHVDQPHVEIATILALVDRFRAGKCPIVVPVYRGRRGHPVVFGRAVFEELLTAPDDQGARMVVRFDPERVAEVVVDDPAVIDDINTPEAYRRLFGHSPTKRFT
jgi:molybdenum cofactor cytidylyltransferase